MSREAEALSPEVTYRGPRIGRPDRLALYDALVPAPTTPANGQARAPLRSSTLLPRLDRLARFLDAPDVGDQLPRLPAALDELAKRLARIVCSRAGRHDDAADAAALLALEDVRARAWNLYVAFGRASAGAATPDPRAGLHVCAALNAGGAP